MELRSIYSLFFWIMFSSSFCYAQEEQKNHLYIGIDLLKNVYNYGYGHYTLEPGIVIEPVVKYTLQNKNVIVAIAGYTRITKGQNLPTNTNYYKSEGYYGKLGFGRHWEISSVKAALQLGGNVFFSIFDEEVHFQIEGEYFGNFTETITRQGMYTIGVEPNISFTKYFWNRVGLDFNLRLDVIFVKSNEEDIANFYVPGIGHTNEPRVISGGFTIALLFKVF